MNGKYEMHSTIWKIFAIGCAVAIKLPTQKQQKLRPLLRKKQNETKRNKRQATVISNHNNCSERRYKKNKPRKRGRQSESERERDAVNELIKTLLPNDRYTRRIRN